MVGIQHPACLILLLLKIVVGNSKRNLGVLYLFERKCFFGGFIQSCLLWYTIAALVNVIAIVLV